MTLKDRINPEFKKEDGSLDWKKLFIGGDWRTFFKWTALFVALMLMAYGYYHDTSTLRDIQKNPCKYTVKISQACMDSRQSVDNDTQNDTERKEKEKRGLFNTSSP